MKQKLSFKIVNSFFTEKMERLPIYKGTKQKKTANDLSTLLKGR